MTDTGNRIKEIRKTLGLTQREFSHKLGMNQSTLSEVEKGKYHLSIDIIKKLVDEYDVNLYYLLADDNEMFLPPDVLSLTRIKGYAFNPEPVKKFLCDFQKSHILQYAVLSEYITLLLSPKGLAIEKEIKAFDKKRKRE